ncbi:MAG: class I SAM-dependent methyltransferase [Planctomycetes bacterium]|nr:class I SAM-dependent methyltransferase [Planctomycetota bacterium]MCB9869596.1 class I SAM-dependent methyltransferase [Planctomycetota bacterium]MCB9889851.1 class I SAM-dependent methyltransferase [Planctomycetota bacterium]
MDHRSEQQRETVAGFWNERHQDAAGEAHDNYLSHPLIQAYISLRAFGSLVSHMDAAKHAILSHTQPGDVVLSLGCGAAIKERWLAKELPDRQFVGIDLADEIIANTREEVRRDGLPNLELRTGDFNELELAADSIRILLGLGAIHHVENLEGLWATAARALRPGGIVLAQEFVGPNRFQWTDAQIAACDEALDKLIPDEHKVHHRRVQRTPVAEMLAVDPSEAVRSAEILDTCRAAGFTIRAKPSAGGALLQPCLMYQIHTFEPQNWRHNSVLARLFEEEDRLMREGVIDDDFVMFVAARD